MNLHPIELSYNDLYYTKEIDSNIKLKRHQLTALLKCIELENESLQGIEPMYEDVKSNIGILCDNVGSGKSFVILAIIKCNAVPKNYFPKQSVHGFFESVNTIYRRVEMTQFKVNIIVCSFSLIEQWEMYIKMFDPKTSYVKINTNKRFERYIENYKFDDIDIMLLSATFYKNVEKFLNSKNIRVNRVVFDEADSTCVPSAKQIHAKFYWFATANYVNCIHPLPRFRHCTNDAIRINRMMISSGIIQNVFIKNLFGSLMRSMAYVDCQFILPRIMIKNHDDYVAESFALPEILSFYIECNDLISDIVSNVSDNQTIIRSVNAGDIATAMAIINTSNSENNVIKVLIKHLENKIINCTLTIDYHKNIISENVAYQNKKIEFLEKEKENLQNKIQYIEERIKSGDNCSICFSHPSNKTIVRCCKNMFCFECICKWLKVKYVCPLCNTSLDNLKNDLLIIKDIEDIDIQNNNLMKLTKLESMDRLLIKLFESNHSAKVLIFSEFDKSFLELLSILKKQQISYGFLKGISLTNTLEKYKDGQISVLMINSKSFGSGINLEMTTDIIMYHSFNIDIEKQVIGRAQRPGRKDNLKIWYMWNTNEYNENKLRASSMCCQTV